MSDDSDAPGGVPQFAPCDATRPVKRSFTIAGHRTSISLEAAFWDALRRIATRRGLTVSALVEEIDRMRGEAGLSGTVRVYILKDLEGRILEDR